MPNSSSKRYCPDIVKLYGVASLQEMVKLLLHILRNGHYRKTHLHFTVYNLFLTVWQTVARFSVCERNTFNIFIVSPFVLFGLGVGKNSCKINFQVVDLYLRRIQASSLCFKACELNLK